MPGVTFNDVYFCEIAGLDIGWPNVSIDILAGFVEDYINHSGHFSMGEVDYWTYLLYKSRASEDPSTEQRVLGFSKCIDFILKYGYITYMDRPDLYRPSKLFKDKWLFMDVFDTTPHSLLPRVREQGGKPTIDDGRHRLSILHALGVKYSPVVYVDVLPPGTRENDWLHMMHFGDVLLGKLVEFSVSPEWRSYKETEFYKLTEPKV